MNPSALLHHRRLVMMLKTRVDSWGSLIISNCDILWLLGHSNRNPTTLRPASSLIPVSQECPHPDSCRTIWLIPLSVPVLLASLTSAPLIPLCCPLHFIHSCLRASARWHCLLLPFECYFTPIWGNRRMRSDGQMVHRAKDGPKGRSLLNSLFPARCLLCSACHAPAPALAPVQCLIDAAALGSSSLSMRSSSAPFFLTAWLQSNLNGREPVRAT